MQPLCFVKALNYALAQQGIAGLPEHELAKDLDLTVPPDLGASYPYAATSDDPKHWGVHLGETSEKLQRILTARNVGLRVIYLAAASIPRDALATLLSDNIGASQSAIVGYRHADAVVPFSELGHAAAVVSASSKTDRIELYEPEAAAIEEVFGPKLYGAMRSIDGGIWLIGPTNSHYSALYPS